MHGRAGPSHDADGKNFAAPRRLGRLTATLRRAHRQARRVGLREPSLLRDSFVNPDAIEQRFASNAAIGQSRLDRDVVQGRCKPNLHVDTALSAIAAPQLRFDIAHGQLDELGACQAKTIVIEATRGRDVELGFVAIRRREVELPQYGERVEGRYLESGRFFAVEQHDAGFPIEGRGFMPVVTGPLRGVEIWLQPCCSYGSAACQLSLPAEEESG